MSSNPPVPPVPRAAAPAPKGAFTPMEGLSDIPMALELVQSALAAAAGLPDHPTAVDYAKAFGASADGVQMKLAILIDQIRRQAAD